MSWNRILIGLLCVFLIFDIGFSFIQHYNVALESDLAKIVLPDESYEKVSGDPFGFSILKGEEPYRNPNRFFAHWTMQKYFRNVPLYFQHVTNPINSIYFSTALAKILIQIFIIYILSVYASGTVNILKRDFIISASLITPFFQTFGYNNSIGIIDLSITYTFFYALSVGLILLFFLPYFRILYHNKNHNVNLLSIILLALLATVLSFFGAINQGVILIVVFLALIYHYTITIRINSDLSIIKKIRKTIKRIPASMFIVLILVSMLSLYSYYIGFHNSENISGTISLSERYLKIPGGLFKMFFWKIGPPLLILMITINTVIIRIQQKDSESKKILNLLKWIGVFVLLYTLLLPLGGYRDYRPDVIRRDTFLPVILLMILYFSLSTLYLLRTLQLNYRKYYLPVVLLFLTVFIISDLEIHKDNACEKQALNTIAQSEEKIIHLDNNCKVMAWELITDYHESKNNTDLLRLWNVTDEEKYYYQTANKK